MHEADLRDGRFARSEAAGVDLAIKGLAESTPDDHELLERGTAIFDGLYTVLKQKDLIEHGDVVKRRLPNEVGDP